MSRDGSLRRLFQHHLPHFDWTPVETGGIVPGVPDLNGCCDGAEVWIECKLTSTWRVKFEDFQPQWIHRRYRAGGRVWIAVRRAHDGGPRLGPPVDELHLIYGGHVLELAQGDLRCQSIATGRWAGGPSRWDWGRVDDLLVGNK